LYAEVTLFKGTDLSCFSFILDAQTHKSQCICRD